MKYFLLCSTLLLFGCGGSKVLTRSQIDTEQIRIDSYYNGHVSFRPSFYDQSDSVFASLTKDDKNIFTGLYTAIRGERTNDSLNAYILQPTYYKHVARQLDAIIATGKAGY